MTDAPRSVAAGAWIKQVFDLAGESDVYRETMRGHKHRYMLATMKLARSYAERDRIAMLTPDYYEGFEEGITGCYDQQVALLILACCNHAANHEVENIALPDPGGILARVIEALHNPQKDPTIG